MINSIPDRIFVDLNSRIFVPADSAFAHEYYSTEFVSRLQTKRKNQRESYRRLQTAYNELLRAFDQKCRECADLESHGTDDENRLLHTITTLQERHEIGVRTIEKFRALHDVEREKNRELQELLKDRDKEIASLQIAVDSYKKAGVA